MTNNDFDIDPQDDFESDAPQKASLKDTWDNNPMMKLAAVVLGGAVLFGAYVTFVGGEEEVTNKSTVDVGNTKGLGAAPGTTEVDPEIASRIEEQNRRKAEEALKTGEGFMPVPLGTSSDDTINVPAAPRTTAEDPLEAWRTSVATRSGVDMNAPPQQEAEPLAAAPDLAVVQPIRPQPAMKMDPAAAKALADQMRVIISAQAPQASSLKSVTRVTSEYRAMKEEEKSGKSGGYLAPGVGGGTGLDVTPVGAETNAKQQREKVIVSAGSIVYAQLLNALNSDVPGPVLAHVLSGPFAGGRALGTFKVQEEFLTIEFDSIVKDGVGYEIEGIALDEKTTLAGHVSDIDRHYFRRIILPAAAKFLEGYASAASESVTVVTTTAGGGVVEAEEPLDTEKELMKGVEEAASEVSSVMQENAKRPITVKLDKGVTFGILFTRTTTTEDVGLHK